MITVCNNRVDMSLQALEQYYEADEDKDTFVKISYSRKRFILLKSEVIQIIKLLMDNEEKEHVILDITQQMLYGHRTTREWNMIEELRNEIKNYFLNEKYNISSITELKEIKEIQRKVNEIKCQTDRFNSFSMNQNKYDNMISILKIIRRLKEKNIYIDMKSIEFDTSKEDESSDYKKILLENSIKEFSKVRFII